MQRWDAYTEAPLIHWSNGRWVLYTDAITALAVRDQRIAELEQREQQAWLAAWDATWRAQFARAAERKRCAALLGAEGLKPVEDEWDRGFRAACKTMARAIERQEGA